MNEQINKKDISVAVSRRISEIGVRVRSQRKKRGLTQQDLAFYSYCDKCQISELERGVAIGMTLFTLFKIAKVLKISENYLFTGD
jgi:transcriptional regulator with XRE-family HTH domain